MHAVAQLEVFSQIAELTAAVVLATDSSVSQPTRARPDHPRVRLLPAVEYLRTSELPPIRSCWPTFAPHASPRAGSQSAPAPVASAARPARPRRRRRIAAETRAAHMPQRHDAIDAKTRTRMRQPPRPLQ